MFSSQLTQRKICSTYRIDHLMTDVLAKPVTGQLSTDYREREVRIVDITHNAYCKYSLIWTMEE